MYKYSAEHEYNDYFPWVGLLHMMNALQYREMRKEWKCCYQWWPSGF